MRLRGIASDSMESVSHKWDIIVNVKFRLIFYFDECTYKLINMYNIDIYNNLNDERLK